MSDDELKGCVGQEKFSDALANVVCREDSLNPTDELILQRCDTQLVASSIDAANAGLQLETADSTIQAMANIERLIPGEIAIEFAGVLQVHNDALAVDSAWKTKGRPRSSLLQKSVAALAKGAAGGERSKAYKELMLDHWKPAFDEYSTLADTDINATKEKVVAFRDKRWNIALATAQVGAVTSPPRSA